MSVPKPISYLKCLYYIIFVSVADIELNFSGAKVFITDDTGISRLKVSRERICSTYKLSLSIIITLIYFFTIYYFIRVIRALIYN